MQRSILVLSLSLSLVVVLTVLLLANRPSPEQQAAKPIKAGPASAVTAEPASATPAPSRRDPETIRALGAIAFQNGRYLLALDYFSEYRAKRPNHVESYTYLAITQLSLDRPAAAAATIAEGLARIDDTPQARGPLQFVLACAQARMGDDPNASHNLALAYHSLGSPLLAATRSPWAKAVCGTSAYKRISEQESAAAEDFRPSVRPLSGALSPE